MRNSSLPTGLPMPGRSFLFLAAAERPVPALRGTRRSRRFTGRQRFDAGLPAESDIRGPALRVCFPGGFHCPFAGRHEDRRHVCDGDRSEAVIDVFGPG